MFGRCGRHRSGEGSKKQQHCNTIMHRYTDDIFILTSHPPCFKDLLSATQPSIPDIIFTTEFPFSGTLRLLDLTFYLVTGFCWQYRCSYPKPLLLRSSCHPKFIKHGIIRCTWSSTPKKLCMHCVQVATSLQIDRLLHGGCPVESVTRSLQTFPQPTSLPTVCETGHALIVPFVHHRTHQFHA